MGMYNEVFCNCPACGGTGYMQIGQIVLGFGGFNLNDYSTLEDLSEEDLLELRARILKENFICQDCGHVFNPYMEKNKEDLIHELFDIKVE